jgi:capsular exopolysaccharide synthesis family protein
LGGLGLIFVVESLDNTVKGPEDAEKLVHLPSLGIIPFLTADGGRKKDPYGSYRAYGQEEDKSGPAALEVREIELVNHLYPKFSIAEDYRTVRTSILFSHADAAPKTIAFTSTLPQEGKTATISNLAVSFAQLEGRVLLIDADLRKPRLSKVFNLRNINGLSSYLAGKHTFNEVLQKTSIDNIWTIPSGPHPPNPAELLNSKRMKELLAEAKERFTVVLLDTPPVLAVIDPVIVSSLVDSTVFVVRAGKTTRRPLARAVEEVRKAKADIIGIVFNEVRIGRQGIGTPFYHYYQYEYEADGSGRPDPGRPSGPGERT